MEWRLILASSRWHRWVRWSAPTGRRPTPGCRSSRRRFYLTPTPDSSPCRWWLRSSRTNLHGGETERWMMLFQLSDHISLQYCALGTESCLPLEAGRSVFPRRHPLHFNACYNSNTTFATFSCSAHLPGLKWHDRFVRPPTLPAFVTFQLGQLAVCPVSFLFGWVGTWVPGNALAQYSEQTWDVAKGCQERTQWIGSGAALWLKGHEVQWTSGALNH